MSDDERRMLWSLYRRVVVLRHELRVPRGAPPVLHAADGPEERQYEALRLDLLVFGFALPADQARHPDERGWLSSDSMFGGLHRAMRYLEGVLGPPPATFAGPLIVPPPATYCA